MPSFHDLNIRGDTITTDEESEADVFHVSDSHSLIQAAGYLKYIYAEEGKKVYFRGQNKIFDGMAPSLFRGIDSRSAQDRRIRLLNEYVEESRNISSLLSGLPIDMVKPLLQHYGVKTSWLDLVDNVWVALWFACHRARTNGRIDEYLHFSRRTSVVDGGDGKYAYIVLVAVDRSENQPVPGLEIGESTEFIDLRVATPSVFVRPHSQHGVLFRLRGGPERRKTDYSSSVVGVIRASLKDAINWLGDGRLLDTHSLFPPPHYDKGYEILLKDLPEREGDVGEMIGSIHHVGA
jgi:hypothetical protein